MKFNKKIFIVLLGSLLANSHVFSAGDSPYVDDSRDHIPLMEAALGGDLPAIEGLVRRVEGAGEVYNFNQVDPESKNTALHRAAAAGHLDVVRYLVGRGAKAYKQNSSGKTPMQVAVESGHQDVVNEIGVNDWMNMAKAGNLEWLNYLHALGISIDLQENVRGQTALHKAVRENKPEAVKFLLERGARKDIKDHAAETPLNIATTSDFSDIVDLLSDKEEAGGRVEEKRGPHDDFIDEALRVPFVELKREDYERIDKFLVGRYPDNQSLNDLYQFITDSRHPETGILLSFIIDKI